MEVSTGNAAATLAADMRPATGVAGGTLVRTLEGVLPIEFLEPGDRVVTRSGARRILAVSVTQTGSVDLVRIRASTLGHDRPAADLLVGPGQPVVIRDWRAQVLFGRDVAAIPAARLTDDEFILQERRSDIRLFALRFAEEEIIWANDLELACPAVVPVSQSPIIAQSAVTSAG